MWCQGSFLPFIFYFTCFVASETELSGHTLTTYPVITDTTIRQVPVFLLHGINNNSNQFRHYESNLTAEGILVIGINTSSFTNLWTQAYGIVADIQSIISMYDTSPNTTMNPFDDGFHLVGISQGGLLARTVVEIMPPRYRIRKLISIAAPQLGIYLDTYAKDDLEAYFSHVPNVLRQMLVWFESQLAPAERMMTYIAYHSYLGQRMSLGNMWHLPWQAQRTVFQAKNSFLPIVNNMASKLYSKTQRVSDDRQGTVESRRMNFLRLESAHFFCSRADEVIVPQASCGFEFYDPLGNNTQVGIESLNRSELYQRDSFGLKTLDESGRLDIRWIDGICHDCWLDWSIPSETNTEQVYADFIYPLLVNV